MRIENLSVALRPRGGWEAVELGFALTRRHARVIYPAWLLCSLPLFVVLHALAWPLDLLWLPPLLMWWLKPVFERIPLYVISRGVFGQAPGLRETLAAQRTFGAGSLLPWLLWRRLSPTRSLLYPVDALEGVRGPLRRARRSALARQASGHAALLLLVCLHLEAILMLSALGLLLMLVPIDFMGDAARAIWETLFQTPPPWALLVMNLLYWLAVSAIAPFYVGAGFGLYLNRRTQIEAWDIELGFRQLARRLAQGTRPLSVLFALLALSGALSPQALARANDTPGAYPADAFDDRAGPPGRKKNAAAQGDRFREVFAHAYADGGEAFVDASAEVFSAPELNPIGVRQIWVPRNPDRTERELEFGDSPAWARGLFKGIALLFENLLWLLAAALLIAVISTHRAWMPRLGAERLTRRAESIRIEAETPAPQPLPADLAAAARSLWRQGAQRAALALLYAGAVQRLAERSGRPLPPGSTEADCLRRARALSPDAFTAWLPRAVRSWQAAAYAQRLPLEAEFEALLSGYQDSAEAQATAAAPAQSA